MIYKRRREKGTQRRRASISRASFKVKLFRMKYKRTLNKNTNFTDDSEIGRMKSSIKRIEEKKFTHTFQARLALEVQGRTRIQNETAKNE